MWLSSVWLNVLLCVVAVVPAAVWTRDNGTPQTLQQLQSTSHSDRTVSTLVTVHFKNYSTTVPSQDMNTKNGTSLSQDKISKSATVKDGFEKISDKTDKSGPNSPTPSDSVSSGSMYLLSSSTVSASSIPEGGISNDSQSSVVTSTTVHQSEGLKSEKDSVYSPVPALKPKSSRDTVDVTVTQESSVIPTEPPIYTRGTTLTSFKSPKQRESELFSTSTGGPAVESTLVVSKDARETVSLQESSISVPPNTYAPNKRFSTSPGGPTLETTFVVSKNTSVTASLQGSSISVPPNTYATNDRESTHSATSELSTNQTAYSTSVVPDAGSVAQNNTAFSESNSPTTKDLYSHAISESNPLASPESNALSTQSSRRPSRRTKTVQTHSVSSNLTDEPTMSSLSSSPFASETRPSSQPSVRTAETNSPSFLKVTLLLKEEGTSATGMTSQWKAAVGVSVTLLLLGTAIAAFFVYRRRCQSGTWKLLDRTVHKPWSYTNGTFQEEVL